MLKFLKKNKNNKGFTLVELVIVVAILAILVGVLAPQYTKYVEKSRKAADASNMDEMVKVIKVYAADPTHNLKAGGYKITIKYEPAENTDIGTTIEPATVDVSTTSGVIKNVTLVDDDLKDLRLEMDKSIPNWNKTKTKSKKWGTNGAKSNIEATVVVNEQGGISVTYGGGAFANYMANGSE